MANPSRSSRGKSNAKSSRQSRSKSRVKSRVKSRAKSNTQSRSKSRVKSTIKSRSRSQRSLAKSLSKTGSTRSTTGEAKQSAPSPGVEDRAVARLLAKVSLLVAHPPEQFEQWFHQRLLTAYDDLETAHEEASEQDGEQILAKMEAVLTLSNRMTALKAKSNPSSSSNVVLTLGTGPQGATGPSQMSSTDQPPSPGRLPEPLVFKPTVFNGDALEFRHHLVTMEGLLKRSQLDDSMKFQYLRSTLPEHARRIVAHINPEAPNLPEAFKALRDHYLNRDKVQEEILKRVMGLPSLKDASSVDQWNMYWELICHVDLNRSSYDNKTLERVVDSLSQRLPPEDYRQLHLDPEPPTVDSLRKFVEPRRKRAQRFAVQRESFDLQRKFFESKTEGQSDRKSDQLRSHANQQKEAPSPQSHTQPRAQEQAGPRWNCLFCSGDHRNNVCPLDVGQKTDKVRLARKCIRCLYSHANGVECADVCRNCRGPHHSWLCPAQKAPQTSQTQNTSRNASAILRNTRSLISEVCHKVDETRQSKMSVAALTTPVKRVTYLPIMEIVAKGESNAVHGNALMDSGATDSFISRGLATAIGAELTPLEPRTIESFGGQLNLQVKERARVKLYSVDGRSCIQGSFFVMPTVLLSDLPVPSKTLGSRILGRGLTLATPTRSENDVQDVAVDILFGMDMLVDQVMSMKPEVIRVGQNLVCTKTNLGWVLQGYELTDNEGPSKSFSVRLNSDHCCDCHEFKWTPQELISGALMEPSTNEKELEYIDEYKRECIEFDAKEQRVTVKLPFLEKDVRPTDNYESMRSKCLGLLKRLRKDGTLERYDAALKTFVQEGTAVRVHLREKSGHFISHFPVCKEGSTTSTRPVFHCSLEKKNERSLNSCLFKGSWPQTGLADMLIKWRLQKYSVFGDIRKAFLQIRIHPDDRQFLRYLWIDDKGELATYEMTSLLFGANASPFILYAVLDYLFKSSGDPCLESFVENVYMDDGLFQERSVKRLAEQIQKATKVAAKGSFELHKWTGPDWLKEELKEEGIKINEEEKEVEKVLGKYWDLRRDFIVFQYHVHEPSIYTRRTLTSIFGHPFDPTGILAPFATEIRLFLQEIYASTYGWDAVVEQHHQDKAKKLLASMQHLNDIGVPRVAIDSMDFELWIFADASSKAYGACAYVRDLISHQSRLLSARGRLSQRDRSMPQLELQAVVLATELMQDVRTKFEKPPKVRIFSDSQVTLSRIANSPNKSHETYVTNRLRDIRKVSSGVDFRYVNTKENPADLISRGTGLKRLCSSTLWFTGPSIEIVNGEPNFPKVIVSSINLKLSNEKRVAWNDKMAKLPFKKFSQFANTFYQVFDRRYGYSKRANAGKPAIEQKSTAQLADQFVWKFVQQYHMSDVVQAIEEKRSLPPKHQLHGKTFIIGVDGLVREDKRLLNSNLKYEIRFPLVVPRCDLVASYIQYVHSSFLHHPGAVHTWSHFRAHMSIPNGLNYIKQILSKCFGCNKANKRTFNPAMPALPPERVRNEQGHAFATVGIDLFGPIYGEKSKKKKYFGMIFTCMTSRAVHLELISGKDKTAVMNALRRFLARFGPVRKIYSDNEPSFVSIARQYKAIVHHLKEVRANVESEFRLSWSFNPPIAKWWGGHYEVTIRMVRKVMENFQPDSNSPEDELRTFLTEAERMVNSRPLVSHSNDDAVLTPYHLLFGHNVAGIPPIQATPEGIDLDINYVALEGRLNSAWKVWEQEYLPSIRNVQSHRSREPVLGELVMIPSFTKERGKYTLAVIHKKLPSQDGTTRKVELKLLSDPKGQNILTRALHVLSPLEHTAKFQEFK